MKTYAFRLHRGDDLRKSLEAFAQEHALRGAVILSCVGCLSHWRLRDASGVNIQEAEEHVEIVSATGTLSAARLHVHISASREDLTALGGHLALRLHRQHDRRDRSPRASQRLLHSQSRPRNRL